MFGVSAQEGKAMTDRTALLALAERCEQSAGPDRELDAEIDAAIGWPTSSYFHQHTRRYTGSLDAALKLVPEGWKWSVNWSHHARLWLGGGMSSAPSNIEQSPGCANPALALCAVALRAKAATGATP